MDEFPNPYPSPEPAELSAEYEPIQATLVVAAAPPRRPRVWTALLLPVFTVLSAIVVSGIFLVVGAIVLSPEGMSLFTPRRPPEEIGDLFSDFLYTPAGLAIMLLPQGFMLAAALGAAWLSPVPLVRRLALGPPRMGIGTLLLCLLAVPCVGLIGSLIVNWLGGSSEQMQQLEEMFRNFEGVPAVFMFLGIGLLPGVCEEVLFRGYTQSRLLQSMPTWEAILIAALLFSCSHVDPVHVLAVIPLGIWLGVVAWAADSVWPAIVCHLGNNLLSVGMTRWSQFDELTDPPLLVLWAVSGTSLVAATVLIARSRREGNYSARAATTSGGGVTRGM